MPPLTHTELLNIAKSISSYYYELDEPKPDNISAPVGEIKKNESGKFPELLFTAEVRYVVVVGKERKIHVINIAFNLGEDGLFDSSSAEII